MFGARQNSISNRVANEVASLLRHDLVTPINLIVGYCDLLTGEMIELGETELLAQLRTIRSFGFILLGLIDQALLTDQPDRSVTDLQILAQALCGPATALVRTCDVLSDSTRREPRREDFDDDLQKIRSAGLQMIEMADLLAQGQIPEANNGSRFPVND